MSILRVCPLSESKLDVLVLAEGARHQAAIWAPFGGRRAGIRAAPLAPHLSLFCLLPKYPKGIQSNYQQFGVRPRNNPSFPLALYLRPRRMQYFSGNSNMAAAIINPLCKCVVRPLTDTKWRYLVTKVIL